MEPFLFQLVGEPLFENQKAAYIAYSNEKVSTCPIQTLGQLPLGKLLGGEHSQTCVKTGYVEGDSVYVIKVAAGGAVGFGNYGLMLAFSQTSLSLETMLLDNGVLTEMRTAATSVLASRILLKENMEKVCRIG